jgi:prepilin-type N-terminal cleavage/methylation domain-containing protein
MRLDIDGNRGDRGFTLVEVLVAIVIFSIVTVGVVPLLASAMKGATLSRSSSVGEQIARDAMERIRGLKFFTSYNAKPGKRVDLLDLYFPQATGTFLPGQSYSPSASNPPVSGTGGVFTTVCPPPSGTNPACPPNVPQGYALTYKASFVKAVTTTTPQTYQIVTPASTYRWDTSAGGNQLPADLMDLGVTVTWTAGGVPRTFTLRSIVGERKFAAAPAVDAGPSGSAPPSAAPVLSGPTIRGRATVDYTFHGETGFSTNATGAGCPMAPCKSEMIADIGLGESRIELQDYASADQSTSYGNVRIVRTYPSGQTPPAIPPADLASATGATSTLHAPPTTTLASDALSDVQTTVAHPEISPGWQAILYNSENRNLKVGVDNSLPVAQGTYGTKASMPSGSTEFYFNNSQRDLATMYFNSASPVAYLQGPFTGWLPPRMGSYTSSTTTALGTAGRAVTSAAEAGFPSMSMLRLQLSRGTPVLFGLQYFKANVSCKSTANPATAEATATWSTYMFFHYDPDNNGREPSSMSTANLTINSSGGDVLNGTPLNNAVAYMKFANPLVVDGSTVCCSSSSDIYIFEERNSSGAITKRGYFRDITVNKGVFTYKSADGRTTQASIDGAVRIDTTPLNPAIPETATSIAVGKLSCESVDNR